MNLGDKAKDQITGFAGIVTGRCQYISGCDQVLLTPRVDSEGKIREGRWLDADRCLVVKAGAIKQSQVSNKARPGGDLPAPTK